MGEVVRFEGADGAFMWVEITRPLAVDDDSEIGLIVDPGEGVRRATTALEDSLASVRGAAVALMATVSEIGPGSGGLGLEEVSLELGLSLGVEGGIIVAKGSAQAEASVTLTWRVSRRD
jgi:hypothetical protein